ncbi:vanadium-dependent haloperoxidase [Bradyrhizobium sp. 6(2017)]|uniref:vanadium-dependent haloperoxidase n=1 Tax=Bradyrhizobium sp. 6(2017) TaxID=1197460 RepID=UPI0013E143B7|nr:vanadium-dependent haloperoxidase [Bradyrhizobium sp. 6(2017)]QIG93473.1 vanadium-dependent haloperoxidase [Bradyrhizobium sp. 6(2017)]
MHAKIRGVVAAVLLTTAAPPAFANVITDWDEKAVVAVTPMAALNGTSPYTAIRMLAMVHTAMFDAVNSIERRYQPYLVQLPADPTTSKDAAAAAAAATVLATIDDKTAGDMKRALVAYLGSIPDGPAKSDGIRLGESVAAKLLEERAHDGSSAPDAYRPRTSPGVYVPTAITLSSMWPDMKPFAMTAGSQFRPAPPVSLDSEDWARDYNEIKDYGGQNSTKRTGQQTETARFWINPLTGYQPFLRQLATAKQMDVVDSARFMALSVVGLNDAIIAVLDAKYQYNFWRPITAIRNGDIDGNPNTDRDATWQPIGPTPMHPEYPCSHCIQSGAVAGVVKAVLGTEDFPEVALTNPALPGVVHHFANVGAMTEEVANARIWAGFHYRFSTRIGTQMGFQIGDYVVKSVMQPVTLAGGR